MYYSDKDRSITESGIPLYAVILVAVLTFLLTACVTAVTVWFCRRRKNNQDTVNQATPMHENAAFNTAGNGATSMYENAVFSTGGNGATENKDYASLKGGETMDDTIYHEI